MVGYPAALQEWMQNQERSACRMSAQNVQQQALAVLTDHE
jgi:hypothetical protein